MLDTNRCGFAHIGLATHDMAATIEFYQNILGYTRVADIQNVVRGGGVVRLVYFDCGANQFLVFMESKNVEGISDDFDTGINTALGLPKGLYHFAMKVNSLEELELTKAKVENHGVAVSEIVNHSYAQSIFMRDPNDLQVEFCFMTRNFSVDDLQSLINVDVSAPASTKP